MDEGGAHTVPVVSAGATSLQTPRLSPSSPTRDSAFRFGQALAVTHAAGADYFGCPPADCDLPRGAMGRAPLPFVPAKDADISWGRFIADYRITPYIAGARDNGSLGARDVSIIERLCDRLRDADFDHEQPALVRHSGHGAARIHGDLWSGNILWTRAADCDWAPPHAGYGPTSHPLPDIVGVLIDPAAQGGHAETDLAYLSVFGQPYLDDIYAGYQSVSALEPGWRDRVGLHQMHILIVHAYLFGGGYGAQTAAVARRYI